MFPCHFSTFSSAGSTQSTGKASGVAVPPGPELLNGRVCRDGFQGPWPKRIKLAAHSAGNFSFPATQTLPSARQVLPLFEPARLELERALLLITGQQRRDQHLQQVLQIIFPVVLNHIIFGYLGTEPGLMPLMFDAFGSTLDGLGNAFVREAIVDAFGLSSPAGRSLQQELIENHSRAVLDPLFHQLLLVQNNDVILELISLGNQVALQRRNNQLLAVANYFPHAKSEQLIRDQRLQAEHWQHRIPSLLRKRDSLRSNHLARCALNSRLFSVFLSRPQSLTEHLRPDQSLDTTRFDRLQRMAKLDFGMRNFNRAHSHLQQAFAHCCALKNKRGVIAVSIQLIEVARRRQPDNIEEALNFFELIRQLCLTYPADLDLYAQLLFQIDDFAQQRLKFPAALRLYQQALVTINAQLPPRYLAKLAYRYAMLCYQQHPNALPGLSQVSKALDSFHLLHRRHHVRPRTGLALREHRGTKFTDITIGEFLRSFAALYRLVATALHTLGTDFVHLSREQQELFAAMINGGLQLDDDINNRLVTEISVGSLQHSGVRLDVSKLSEVDLGDLRLVTADCYLNALKILLDVSKEEEQQALELFRYRAGRQGTAVDAPAEREALHWRLFTAIFDELVQFYCQSGQVAALTRLLDPLNFIIYPDLDLFFKKIPGWQNSLATLKKKMTPASARRADLT